MMKKIEIIFAELRRCVFSLRFILAVILSFFVLLLSAYTDDAFHASSSLMYIQLAVQHSPFGILYLICAALPGALGFCEDWDNRFYRSIIIRGGRRNYCLSKSISCGLSAFLAIFLSGLLFFGLLSMFYPLSNSRQQTGFENSVYSGILSSNFTFLFFIILSAIKASCAACFAVMALWITALIPNLFVALAAPMIAFYFIRILGVALRIPNEFNVEYISKGLLQLGESPWLTLIYGIGFFLVLSVLAGYLFDISASRRIENG